MAGRWWCCGLARLVREVVGGCSASARDDVREPYAYEAACGFVGIENLIIGMFKRLLSCKGLLQNFSQHTLLSIVYSSHPQSPNRRTLSFTPTMRGRKVLDKNS